MGDFRIKMISCKLISTKKILGLKKKRRIMLKKTNKQINKQTKQTQESHTKNSIFRVVKKNLTQTKSPISPPNLPPLKSQMVDP